MSASRSPKRFGVPLLVVSEDVFPEIATKLRRLENPVLVGVLRQLVRLYLKRADRVVAIGETMRRRLEAKGAPGERLRVIPNWIDTEAITPSELENEWKRKQKLAGRFVVMHSGNVGHAQDLDVLVRATTFLRDLDDLAVVIVGFGARHAEILSLAARLETDKVRFLPYQPREVLPLSLAAGNLHFVGLARGLVRLRRAEPAVRDPRRRPPGDRLCGRRQRDGAGRVGGRLRRRASAGPPRAASRV